MLQVLWIEDDAVGASLQHFASAIIRHIECNLDVSLNATDGWHKLMSNTYDVVIVDIRLMPGSEKYWKEIFQRTSTKQNAKLGLEILRRLFGNNGQDDVPTWINLNKFAVFTVEAELEIGNSLNQLNITHYLHKSTSVSPIELVNLIAQIADYDLNLQNE